MDINYLPYNSQPSQPEFTLPKGSVDAHCHVVGPAEQFPYSSTSEHSSNDASKYKLFALRDQLGVSRNVIVQRPCYGTDNSALLDALQCAGELARGVAVIDSEINSQLLQDMHFLGVRAVYFDFTQCRNDAPIEAFWRIAQKVKPLGWHVVAHFEPDDFYDVAPFLVELGMPVVIDHMGSPDFSKGVEHHEFQRLVKLLAEYPQISVKVSRPHLIQTGDESMMFARYLVEHFPQQVLWGTHWPDNNAKSLSLQVNSLPNIAPTLALQKALLIDNPMKLYW